MTPRRALGRGRWGRWARRSSAARRADGSTSSPSRRPARAIRRRLRGRFAAWTRDERPRPRPAAGRLDRRRPRWAVFGRYRETSDDSAPRTPRACRLGLAALAAPAARLAKPGHGRRSRPGRPDRGPLAGAGHCHRRPRSMPVTSPCDPDPALADSTPPVDVDPPPVPRLGVRRGGRRARRAFRPACRASPRRPGTVPRRRPRRRPARTAAGSRSSAARRGEGLGLLLAREVTRPARRRGPSRTRSWSSSRRLGRRRRAGPRDPADWGIPASAGGGRPLAPARRSPPPAAVRLAGRRLGDGADPPAPQRPGPLARTRPATAVGGRGGVGGPGAPRLPRPGRRSAGSRPRGIGPRPEGPPAAAAARRCSIGWLDAVDAIARPGPWPSRSTGPGGRRRARAATRPTLDALWDALDDQGGSLTARAGDRRGVADLGEFAGAGRGDPRRVDAPPTAGAPGDGPVARSTRPRGPRARVSSWPTWPRGRSRPRRRSTSTAADDGAAGRPDPAFAREMLRFLRVVGSADERLVLVYPTTDEKGQDLLPAGSSTT